MDAYRHVDKHGDWLSLSECSSCLGSSVFKRFEGLVKLTLTLVYKYLKMLLDVDMLGVFFVEFMACHVTARWVATSVRIFDGVKSHIHYWMSPHS